MSAVIHNIEGDLDFASASRTREHLIHLLNQGQKDLTVDLGAAGYVDSAGLLALIAVATRASGAGGSVRVRNPSATLMRMLNLSHAAEVLGLASEALPLPARRRHTDTGVGRWDVFRFVVPATAQACAQVRRAVIQEAARTPLTPACCADLELAVGEAFANAVRHGSPRGEQDRVTVRCLVGRDAVVVEVADEGLGFDRSEVVLPRPEEIREGGMGIFYMEAVMDSVEFEYTTRGMVVRLAKVYPGARGSATRR
ncbi:MAG: ATP-binding protein [Armatimonadetes bacterium]|nr:ATP-binding protein [Armatimonadota bacterium]